MHRYGNFPVVKIINIVNRLRRAIRDEGSPKIQAIWDELEPVIDFFLRRPAGDENRDGE